MRAEQAPPVRGFPTAVGAVVCPAGRGTGSPRPGGEVADAVGGVPVGREHGGILPAVPGPRRAGTGHGR